MLRRTDLDAFSYVRLSAQTSGHCTAATVKTVKGRIYSPQVLQYLTKNIEEFSDVTAY